MQIPVIMYYWNRGSDYKVINPSNLASPSYSSQKSLF
jgi:hypothetical protein